MSSRSRSPPKKSVRTRSKDRQRDDSRSKSRDRKSSSSKGKTKLSRSRSRDRGRGRRERSRSRGRRDRSRSRDRRRRSRSSDRKRRSRSSDRKPKNKSRSRSRGGERGGGGGGGGGSRAPPKGDITITLVTDDKDVAREAQGLVKVDCTKRTTIAELRAKCVKWCQHRPGFMGEIDIALTHEKKKLFAAMTIGELGLTNKDQLEWTCKKRQAPPGQAPHESAKAKGYRLAEEFGGGQIDPCDDGSFWRGKATKNLD